MQKSVKKSYMFLFKLQLFLLTGNVKTENILTIILHKLHISDWSRAQKGRG